LAATTAALFERASAPVSWKAPRRTIPASAAAFGAACGRAA